MPNYVPPNRNHSESNAETLGQGDSWLSVEHVERSLDAGRDLRRWWLDCDANDAYPNVFSEAKFFNRPEDHSFGFIGSAPLRNGPVPINGNVQQMFYDAPKSRESRRGMSTEWIRAQIREFILHYFMRVSDYRPPQPTPDPRAQSAFPILKLFSQCSDCDASREGFGFSQLFYKLRDSQEVHPFPPDQQNAIVDLREMGKTYEWILLKNPIYNFDLSVAPLGARGPKISLPLSEFNYLVVSSDFIIDEANPEPGVLGRYGIGYAFVPNPSPGLFAYGPGNLGPAFEQLNWNVMDDGRILARFAFVANQPDGLLNVSLDPFQWIRTAMQAGQNTNLPSTARRAWTPLFDLFDRGPFSQWKFDPVLPAVDLLNVATMGQASRQLCISRTDIIKSLLYVHFLQHYQMAVGTLQTWRQVQDWLDRDALPSFVRTGNSA